MKNTAIYRTVVYVDGELLARRLADAPYDPGSLWFDLTAFAIPLLPFDHDLVAIRYYAGDMPGDKHHAYFHGEQRAIVRLPHRCRSQLDDVGRGHQQGGELGSVLTSHLLRDGAANLYDAALIVADDPALATPVHLVTRRMGKRAGVVWPTDRDVGKIVTVASFTRYLNDAQIAFGRLAVEEREVH